MLTEEIEEDTNCVITYKFGKENDHYGVILENVPKRH